MSISEIRPRNPVVPATSSPVVPAAAHPVALDGFSPPAVRKDAVQW